MSEWKVVLEKKKRTIKSTNKDERVANIAVVITNDAYQFIVSEYEETDVVSEKDEFVVIDGGNYKQFGGNRSYYPTIDSAIYGYLKEYKILNPSRDILSLKEATDYLLEIVKLAESMYSIKSPSIKR